MSNSYEIDGVTITPQPGGYYELTHPNLPQPIRERGKEKADERARTVAKAFEPDEGRMDPQGAPPETPGVIEVASPPAPATMTPPAPTENTPPPAAEAEAPVVDDRDDEMEKLRARVAELEAAGVQTVAHTGGPSIAAQKLVPQAYAGQMDDETKAMLAKLGVKTVTIMLEENENIPPTGLFISHNYRPYMIKPGEKVDVPEFLVKVLDNAVTSQPIQDSNSLKVLGYRDRMRYPYRRMD